MKMKQYWFSYRFFLFFISAFTSVSVYAQELQWSEFFYNNEPRLISVQQTSDSTFLLGGYERSITSSYWDYILIKSDSSGHQIWKKQFGGTQQEILASAIQALDGGYVLGGVSRSPISGNKTENCIGYDDYWVVKTDSLGNIQWQNTIGGDSGEFFASIVEAADKGFLLVGYSLSSISGDKTEISRGETDLWIVKIDSTGSIQWQKTIGGSGWEEASSVLLTKDGGYLIGATSNSGVSGEKTEAALGYYDCWLLKLDSVGNIMWQNTIGGSGYDRLRDIAPSAEGGFILLSESGSPVSGDKTSPAKGAGSDYWVIKIDSIGNIIWDKTIGGSSFDMGHSIIQNYKGEYVIAGESISPISGDKTESLVPYSEHAIWIVCLNPNGSIKWQNTLQDSHDPFASHDEYEPMIIETFDHDLVLSSYVEYCSFWPNCYTYGALHRITDKVSSIIGKVFVDLNSDGIQDSLDWNLPNQKITESSSGKFEFTNTDGNYVFNLLNTGNYSVTAPNFNYHLLAPSNHSGNFSTMLQIDSLNDFAYQPLGNYNDLWIQMTALGPSRPGFKAYYQLNYGNNGTTILSPSIKFYLSQDMNFVSSSITPSWTTIDSIGFNLPVLMPFQTGSILIIVDINTGVTINSQIISNASVFPLLGDATPASNNAQCVTVVTGSYDPNDITVDKITITTLELAAQPFLEYLVRFQNTGNDTAFNVKISNPIDTSRFEISSIEFVNSSHPVNMRWINWEGNLEFKFNSILLPDSGINEALSHGFVKYRIKAKSNISLGDSICNKAYIYFDYNSPIVTNKAKTIIVMSNSIRNEGKVGFEEITIFPNPVKDELIVHLNFKVTGESINIKLFDVTMREIASKQITSDDNHLSLSKFSSGIYFVEINHWIYKVVKQ
ncbi:MAG: T9SS type A sorting domain-containing protein [Bacteroidetes bacterium]|nr:T9SS type A sorting domain-containing protein [Bacteroidota bacterium]MBP6414312.1 T9SS type A sorting domain-containing protein [Bacteroidia bacterium]